MYRLIYRNGTKQVVLEEEVLEDDKKYTAVTAVTRDGGLMVIWSVEEEGWGVALPVDHVLKEGEVKKNYPSVGFMCAEQINGPHAYQLLGLGRVVESWDLAEKLKDEDELECPIYYKGEVLEEEPAKGYFCAEPIHENSPEVDFELEIEVFDLKYTFNLEGTENCASICIELCDDKEDIENLSLFLRMRIVKNLLKEWKKNVLPVIKEKGVKTLICEATSYSRHRLYKRMGFKDIKCPLEDPDRAPAQYYIV